MFGRLQSYKVSVVMDAPPEKLFTYISDLNRHHEWVGTEVGNVTDGPVGLGSSFDILYPEYEGGPGLATYTVTEFVPNRRLAYETRDAGVKGQVEVYFFELEPETSGRTRVTHGRRLAVTGAVGCLLWLFLPVTLPGMLVFAAVHRPYMGWSTRRKLWKMAETVERGAQAEPPQEAEPPQPECPHVTLVPNWGMAEDMGDLEKVSRYTCEACGAGFSREEGDQLRAKGAERKVDKISQLAAMERERQRRSERDR